MEGGVFCSGQSDTVRFLIYTSHTGPKNSNVKVSVSIGDLHIHIKSFSRMSLFYLSNSLLSASATNLALGVGNAASLRIRLNVSGPLPAFAAASIV